MIYGYARVSTKGQAINGNSLEEQRKALLESGCVEIVEEQGTGTTIHRPKFEELLEKLQDGDMLKVTKLDRFARTAADGSKLAKELLERGIGLHILNMGMIDNTPTGRLIANVLFSFAEFERDMIVERTQAGKAIAKTKSGFREGRPPISDMKKKYAVDLIRQGNSYKKVCEMTGLSRSTVSRAVNSGKI